MKPNDPKLDAHNKALIEQHMGFVEFIARQECATSSRALPFDDAIAYAVEGLLVADGRFNGGVEFKTYAEPVIRYAIRNGAAEMSDQPMRRRDPQRYAVAYEENEEAAAAVHAALSEESLELDALQSRFLETDEQYRQFASDAAALLDAATIRDALWAHIQRDIEELPELEARTIKAQLEEYEHKKLAKDVGRAQSTVSRHFAKAVKLLRSRFDGTK